MATISPRSIERLLIANRQVTGEIAARIIASARELGITVYAVCTEGDVGHTIHASHTIPLDSPADYMNVDTLVNIAQTHRVDAVHPGYGFLSESAVFAHRLAEINVLCVGPGARNLDRTGDKLQARKLALECSVPVLPALTTPTNDIARVSEFAEQHGFPIMIKAVDGGGGRGIRLVRDLSALRNLATRAIEESPSKQVFAERAAVDGFRHVEVQVVGDSHGNVMHLWERECSIQRRYQKIVEVAPATSISRKDVARVIQAALSIARKIKYESLGTFEFLVNPVTHEFFFLEINPRLQVEHTITESICSVDIVRIQLMLAQGSTFLDAGLLELSQDPASPPQLHSVQLRVTAEDPGNNYSLSIGRIHAFTFPSGPGVRVDTALTTSAPITITSDFDSLIAKIVITARTWREIIDKAHRALTDTEIQGVHTNLAVLRAIVASEDFKNHACDTQWLELKHGDLMKHSRVLEIDTPSSGKLRSESLKHTTNANVAPLSGSTLFRKGDAWIIDLDSLDNAEARSATTSSTSTHHLQITQVLRNDFPDLFAANIAFTVPGGQPAALTMRLKSTSASGSAVGSRHPQGSRDNHNHVIMPLSGKLVEVLVDVGDFVAKDQPICVVKQMKMEIEVRTHKAGYITWLTEVEDNEDVAEGMLAAIVEDSSTQPKL